MRFIEVEQGITVELDSVPADARVLCLKRDTLTEILRTAVVGGFALGAMTMAAGLFIHAYFFCYMD